MTDLSFYDEIIFCVHPLSYHSQHCILELCEIVRQFSRFACRLYEALRPHELKSRDADWDILTPFQVNPPAVERMPIESVRSEKSTQLPRVLSLAHYVRRLTA